MIFRLYINFKQRLPENHLTYSLFWRLGKCTLYRFSGMHCESEWLCQDLRAYMGRWDLNPVSPVSLMLPSYHSSCLPAIVRKEKQIGKESKTSCLKSILRVHCCLVAKLCPALCDPMDGSQPDSSVQGIVQARILEWVAISSSRRSFQPRDQTHIFCVSFQADSLSLSHQGSPKGPIAPL